MKESRRDAERLLLPNLTARLHRLERPGSRDPHGVVSECDRNFWFRNGELVELRTLLSQLSLDGWKGKRYIAAA